MKHSTSESYSITRCASKTVKLILTNEEWFCQLPTEEKAKVIVNIHNLAKLEQIEWWLKQPHTPFS